MNSGPCAIEDVSDTAFWVAFYRSVESEKKDALFRDPLAALLAGEYGKRVSGSMRPFEKYAYWSVTVRTPLVDEYILKYAGQGYRTVINLGAGLDTRPYRLSLPPELQWIEVDFPKIIELKDERLKNQKPNCSLERIGLDLSNRSKRAGLFGELNARVGPAVVLTEGVVPYLDEDAVAGLAHDIRQQSNFQLWVAEYYSPEMYPRYQSQKFKNSLGGSPFRFFPSDWFSFFENCGWTQKEMTYLYDEAVKHNRKFPLPWWASLLRLLVGEQRAMEQVRKYSAYVVFEKQCPGQGAGVVSS